MPWTSAVAWSSCSSVTRPRSTAISPSVASLRPHLLVDASRAGRRRGTRGPRASGRAGGVLESTWANGSSAAPASWRRPGGGGLAPAACAAAAGAPGRRLGRRPRRRRRPGFGAGGAGGRRFRSRRGRPAGFAGRRRAEPAAAASRRRRLPGAGLLAGAAASPPVAAGSAASRPASAEPAGFAPGWPGRASSAVGEVGRGVAVSKVVRVEDPLTSGGSTFGELRGRGSTATVRRRSRLVLVFVVVILVFVLLVVVLVLLVVVVEAALGLGDLGRQFVRLGSTSAALLPCRRSLPSTAGTATRPAGTCRACGRSGSTSRSGTILFSRIRFWMAGVTTIIS